MSDKAKLIRKIIFETKMQNESPLRIASGLDDGLTDILILKNKQGQPFVPGTSLTGVLRAEIKAVYGEAAADKLFGSVSGSQSMINISDIILENYSLVTRDGVAIDEITGVGKSGAKYDYEALDRGAMGKLFIEITVRQADVDSTVINDLHAKHETFAMQGDIYGDMAASLADILTRGIKVGSLTAKGYGKIASLQPAAWYDFDFSKKGAADAWLQYVSGCNIPEWVQGMTKGHLPAKAAYTAEKNETVFALGDCYITLQCALRSSMIVRSDDMNEKQESENIKSVQLTSGKDFVLPGTSIKGVLRNKAYKILLALSGNNTAKAKAFLDKCMGYSTNAQSAKSNLEVDEVYLNEGLTPMQHSRNRIDRFTGGTVESALFTEEPIWQQNKSLPTVKFKLRLKKCTEAQAGLLLLLVKDIWLGNISFGGGKSIGRGVMDGIHCQVNYQGNEYIIDGSHGFAVQGDKNTLEGYVQKLGGEMQ